MDVASRVVVAQLDVDLLACVGLTIELVALLELRSANLNLWEIVDHGRVAGRRPFGLAMVDCRLQTAICVDKRRFHRRI